MSMAKQNIKAIIYDRKGKVLSVGYNSYVKTHTLQAKHAAKVGQPLRQYLHAETHAIIKCRDISKAHTIKVFRYGKDGRELLAKPCPACMSCISETPIQNIEWTVSE